MERVGLPAAELSRIYPRDTSIFADGLVYLVGSRPTSWQSGEPFYFFSPYCTVPQPRAGCMAPDREFLLPDHLSALTVSALRESGLAVLFVYNGWPYARPVCASFLCFSSL
jgi:hypothetical protein